jgi:HNH endonuclease
MIDKTMQEPEETLDFPEWLATYIDQKFLDPTGNWTYEDLPDHYIESISHPIWHMFCYYLAQHGELQSLKECEFLVEEIIPQYDKQLIQAVINVTLKAKGDLLARKALCPICHTLPISDRLLIACSKCKQQYIGESQLIKIHLYRARKARTAATLTLPEWIETLRRFNYRCAYCEEGSYEVLEHYVPISQGGGTTTENCVPACRKCNAQKSGKHPELAARY